MQSKGLVPNGHTYYTLCVAYLRAGLVKKCKETLHVMRRAGFKMERVYNDLIFLLIKEEEGERKVKDETTKREEMTGRGREEGEAKAPENAGDKGERTAEMGGEGKEEEKEKDTGKVKAAEKREEKGEQKGELKEEQKGDGKETIGQSTYKCAQIANKYEVCWELLEHMKNAGVRGDKFLYTALLNMYGNKGDTGKLAEIRKIMEKSGWKPNVVVFTCLIQWFGKAGDLQKCDDLMREMVNVYRIVPTHSIFQSLIESFGQKNQQARVEGWYQNLVNMRLEPNTGIKLSLRKYLGKEWLQKHSLYL
jgi:pentatricopeptide repeat protein